MAKLEMAKREIYGFCGPILPLGNLKKKTNSFLEIMSVPLAVYFRVIIICYAW